MRQSNKIIYGLFLLLFFNLLIFGCAENNHDNNVDSSTVEEELLFNIKWVNDDETFIVDKRFNPSHKNYFSILLPSMSKAFADLTGCPGLTWVEVTLYESADASANQLGSLEVSCTDGSATLTGDFDGTGRKLVVLGKDSNRLTVFRGQQLNISIDEGEQRNIGTVSAPTFIPTVSSPANGAIFTSNSPSLEWSSVENAASYKLTISTNSDLSSPVVDNIDATSPYAPTGLSDNTNYYWQVYAEDSYGNISQKTSINSFSLDATIPSIDSVNPSNGATDISISTTVSAVFSEVMDENTIDLTTFTINDGTSNISGTVQFNTNSKTAIFIPSSLNYNTAYTATISSNVSDLAGNNISSSYSWSFTTGNQVDTQYPTVQSVFPTNGSSAVSVDTTITAEFSEAMNSSTIDQTTFTITDGTSSVTGTVSYSGVIATFTPSSSLQYGTSYTATIESTVADIAGNSLQSDYSWSFQTEDQILAPTVTTQDATSIGTTSATLNGTVNPNGGATTYYFEYGTSTSYGSQSATETLAAGTSNKNVIAPITGLTAGTTYNYRLVASNDAGTTVGINVSFTTTTETPSDIPKDGLVAEYLFDGNANDTSGNGNHGTVNGAAITSDKDGNAYSAYSFDGNNDNIEIPNSSNLGLSTWTISGWIYFNQLPENSTLILTKDDDSNLKTNYAIALTGSGAISSQYETCTSESGNNVYYNTPQKNSWIFFSSVNDGITHSIFIDGIVVDSNSSTDACVSNEKVFIGGCIHNGLNKYFNGIIDNIRIYNRALSESEIQALYNEGQ